ncbi:hypothetical protein ACFO8Q_12185 [Effusibacillus consociatus]|uniref:Uncharacterized protein n=2 Tax=Effusibacillus consociatus TaxID=1117041 RepID=A0ABV9Q1J5_9BACL
MSYYLPATYAVEGNMNLLFGGPRTGDSSLALFRIMMTSIAIGGLVVAGRKETRKEFAPQMEKVS